MRIVFLFLLLQAGTVFGGSGGPIFINGFDCRGMRPWSQAVGATPGPAPAPAPEGQPALQCEWAGPPPGDPFPDHFQVLSMPMVADLPYPSSANVEIVFVAYNNNDGGADASSGTSTLHYGIYRVLDGCTCEQIATIHDPSNPIIGASSPALGDIDGDGTVEIVGLRAGGGLVTSTWNAIQGKYVTWWATDANDTELEAKYRWDGPSLHDLDDDGIAEVISGHEVYDGVLGTRLNPTDTFAQPTVVPTFAVVDLDGNDMVDLAADSLYFWDTDRWWVLADGPFGQRHSAVADFGTATLNTFDPTTRDGVAEVVTISSIGTSVALRDIFGNSLMSVPLNSTRSAPAIADFDGDGFPEIAVADTSQLRVLDLDCSAAGGGCVGGFVRWASPIQDGSSGGSTCTAIDLDGNGSTEVVYADECWGRLYDGLSGNIIASWPRVSCTFGEGISIADIDGDGSGELLVPSNSNCNIECPDIDPLHEGLRCAEDSECISGTCDSGFCRCSSTPECPVLHECTVPLAGTPGAGSVCRASQDPFNPFAGLRVWGDPHENVNQKPRKRIWNQHTYSVTNVNDDGSVPKTTDRVDNHATNGPNSFRAP